LNRLHQTSEVYDSLQLPPQLKRRCLLYDSFTTVHNACKDHDLTSVGLSADLLQEVRLYIFETLVSTAPFFEGVPAPVVMNLVLAFEQEVYNPGRHFFNIGEKGLDMFFIIKGKADVLSEAYIVLVVKRVGDYFGEISLVFDKPRSATVRARTFCIVAKLSRKSFRNCLERTPDVQDLIINRMVQQLTFLKPDAETTPLLSGERQAEAESFKPSTGSTPGLPSATHWKGLGIDEAQLQRMEEEISCMRATVGQYDATLQSLRQRHMSNGV